MIASAATAPNRPTDSMLDEPLQHFADAPFFAETLTLLRSVRDHDFKTLPALCDDDFGIVDVDVDPAGTARTFGGWREARWHASVIASDVPPELEGAS